MRGQRPERVWCVVANASSCRVDFPPLEVAEPLELCSVRDDLPAPFHAKERRARVHVDNDDALWAPWCEPFAFEARHSGFTSPRCPPRELFWGVVLPLNCSCARALHLLEQTVLGLRLCPRDKK